MKTVDKQRWSTETRRPRRRGPSSWGRWIRLLIFVLLAVLALHGLGFGLGAFLSTGVLEKTGDERSKQQTDTPAVEQQQEETEKTPAPIIEDPTLYLTVPEPGIYQHSARNDRSGQA